MLLGVIGSSNEKLFQILLDGIVLVSDAAHGSIDSRGVLEMQRVLRGTYRERCFKPEIAIG